MIGRKLLDKYEITRVIGHGGMGTVYEAREIQAGRRVALKWMHARPFAPDDPDLLRFTQEARIAGRLDSPHVTAVLELARDPETDVPFQVMELLEGEDVRKLVERLGPLEPDVALRIAAQACAGLAAAHAAGVVHRDIKPDNIFLAQKDGEVVVKLLDFGIAKIRGTPENAGMTAGFTAPAIPMTQSGQVVGTPLFMAPEQIEGAKHVDARCDVYSMGVTLFAMLTGSPPHGHVKSFVELLHTLVNAPTVPLREAAPWVSEEAAAVVDRARTKEKEARYPDAKALLEALGPLLPNGTALRPDMLRGAEDAEKHKAASMHADTLPNGLSASMAARVETTKRGERAARAKREEKALPQLVWIFGAVLVVAVIAGVVAMLLR